MGEVRPQLVEHIPNAVVEGLWQRGVDVPTVAEAGVLGHADEQLLEYALREDGVVVTHDRDFPRLHHQQRPHAGVFYSKRGTRSIGEIIAGLFLILQVLDAADMVGKIEYL